MNREYAISLLAGNAQPLPPEDHPDWAALATYLDQHPELEAWFANSSPADKALSLALTDLHTDAAPPAFLEREFTTPQVATSRRSWLKAAASVALLGGGAGAWLSRPIGYEHLTASVSYQAFCSDMCIYASRLLSLDHKAADLTQLRSWMQNQKLPVPTGTLPALVAKQMGKGCKRVPWGQRQVGLICFVRDSGQIVHIFSLPRTELASIPDSNILRQPLNYTGREVVGWADESCVNILVSAKPGTPTADLLS